VLSTSTKFQDLPISFQRIGKQVRVEELSFFTRQEARSLITEPVQDAHLSYSPEAIAAITDCSASHPFLIQLICHEIFEYALKENVTRADEDAIDIVLPHVLEKSLPPFEQSTNGLSQRELQTLAACALVSDQQGTITLKSLGNTLRKYTHLVGEERDIERNLNELQRRNILQEEKQHVYSFTIPLLGNWILKTYSFEIPPRSPLMSNLRLVIGGGAVALVAAVIAFLVWGGLPLQPTTTPTPTQQMAEAHTPTPLPIMTPSPTPAPTEVPPTEVPPTEAPATEVPPTEVPATEVPPTEVPPTEVPPTEVPPTEVPATEVPSTPAPVIMALPTGLQFLDLGVVGTGDLKLIYALAKDAGIYRRDANGSWSLFSNGLDDANGIRTLEAQSASTLYVGYDNGARRWTAAGGWSDKYPLPRVRDFAVVPNTGVVFAGTDRGVFRSTDDGVTWEAMNKRLNGDIINEAVYSLAVGQDPAGDWILYAAGAYGGHIFKATIFPDQESTIPVDRPRWEDIPCNNCGTFQRFFTVAVDPANAETVYVGNDRSRVSLSSNGGGSWNTAVVPVGGATEVFITKIVVPEGNMVAYAATGSNEAAYASNGVLIRQDNGWSVAIPPGFFQGRDYVQGIALDPDDPQVIYVAGSNGLFRFDYSTSEWIPSP